jgi:hypothetical protein
MKRLDPITVLAGLLALGVASAAAAQGLGGAMTNLGNAVSGTLDKTGDAVNQSGSVEPVRVTLGVSHRRTRWRGGNRKLHRVHRHRYV